MNDDRPSHFHIFPERLGLKHQHIATFGKRQLIFGKERFLTAALIESAGIEKPPDRRQIAADRRDRIRGIKTKRRAWILRRGGLRAQPAIGVEIIRNELCPLQRESFFIAPMPAMAESAVV